MQIIKEDVKVNELIKNLNMKADGYPYTGTSLQFLQDEFERELVSYSKQDVTNQSFIRYYDPPNYKSNYHSEQKLSLYFEDKEVAVITYSFFPNAGQSLVIEKINSITIH